MHLPSARLYVHGVGGQVERAGAGARFWARTAAQAALVAGKVGLWLTIVSTVMLVVCLAIEPIVRHTR